VSCQPGEDPFTLLRQEKRERVKTQQKQQLANVKQALKAGGASAVPATLRLAAALPSKGKGKPTKRKELRDEVRGEGCCGGVGVWCWGC
jgi:regulator of ribosome biosynthesis